MNPRNDRVVRLHPSRHAGHLTRVLPIDLKHQEVIIIFTGTLPLERHLGGSRHGCLQQGIFGIVGVGSASETMAEFDASVGIGRLPAGGVRLIARPATADSPHVLGRPQNLSDGRRTHRRDARQQIAVGYLGGLARVDGRSQWLGPVVQLREGDQPVVVGVRMGTAADHIPGKDAVWQIGGTVFIVIRGRNPSNRRRFLLSFGSNQLGVFRHHVFRKRPIRFFASPLLEQAPGMASIHHDDDLDSIAEQRQIGRQFFVFVIRVVRAQERVHATVLSAVTGLEIQHDVAGHGGGGLLRQPRPDGGLGRRGVEQADHVRRGPYVGAQLSRAMHGIGVVGASIQGSGISRSIVVDPHEQPVIASHCPARNQQEQYCHRTPSKDGDARSPCHRRPCEGVAASRSGAITTIIHFAASSTLGFQQASSG